MASEYIQNLPSKTTYGDTDILLIEDTLSTQKITLSNVETNLKQNLSSFFTSGSGTKNNIAIFSADRTLSGGASLGSNDGTFLRHDGTWATPTGSGGGGNYLSTGGGTMTGTIKTSATPIIKPTDTKKGVIQFLAGDEWGKGASLNLKSKEFSSNNPGAFELAAGNDNGTHTLIGKTDGSLTWDSNNVVRANTSGVGNSSTPVYANSKGELLTCNISESGSHHEYCIGSYQWDNVDLNNKKLPLTYMFKFEKGRKYLVEGYFLNYSSTNYDVTVNNCKLGQDSLISKNLYTPLPFLRQFVYDGTEIDLSIDNLNANVQVNLQAFDVTDYGIKHDLTLNHVNLSSDKTTVHRKGIWEGSSEIQGDFVCNTLTGLILNMWQQKQMTSVTMNNVTSCEYLPSGSSGGNSSGFYNCSNLQYASLENLEDIGGSFFSGCSKLRRVNLPKLKTIDTASTDRVPFGTSQVLSTIIVPNLTTITYGYEDMFYNNIGLKYIVLSAVEQFPTNFYNSLKGIRTTIVDISVIIPNGKTDKFKSDSQWSQGLSGLIKLVELSNLKEVL